MNLTNHPKNISLLIFGTILIGVVTTFLLIGIILIPYVEDFSNGSFNMLSLARKTIISIQAINMIGFFILPPVLFAFFSKNDFTACFNLGKKVDINRYLLASLLAFMLFPILVNLQFWVENAPLPEMLRITAESQKAKTEAVLELFLNQPGLSNLALMILIIGVGAGLTEELFFRGLLLPWFEKMTKSTWVAIIISGSIFSLFHANVYDFLPILLVGILFGYIYTQTQDLKLNIFIHALFNSFQVILNYLHENKFIATNIEEVKSFPIVLWFVCLCLAFVIVYFLIKKNEYISHSG